MVRLFAVMVAAATLGQGQMAALIGHDHVTAVYPGFHKVEGDATALGAVGANRRMANGWGEQDAITVRKVATLTKEQVATFGFSNALEVAERYEDRAGFGQKVTSQPFSNLTRTTVCGNEAYGFSRAKHIVQPIVDSNPVDWTDFDTFVVAVIGPNVWQAEYTRLYEPGLYAKAAQLIAFTSNFCVKAL
jgi:hypothetical protein